MNGSALTRHTPRESGDVCLANHATIEQVVAKSHCLQHDEDCVLCSCHCSIGFGLCSFHKVFVHVSCCCRAASKVIAALQVQERLQLRSSHASRELFGLVMDGPLLHCTIALLLA
jgi:hypothetical protein